MKKFNFLLLLVIGLLAGTQSFAQLAVDKGTKFLNVGVGVGGGYGYGGLGGYGGYNRGILLGASFEVGVAPNITVGGFADYRRISFSGITGLNDYGVNYIYIGARGSYHFNELLSLPTDKADLYAGIGLGYLSANYDNAYFNGYNAGGIFVPIHIGGRYFFSEKIGGFAEIGSGVSLLKLGVTFRF